MGHISRCGLVFLGLCLCVTGASQAATYYVDPVNGNINNDGSAEHPWSTLQAVFEAGKFKRFAWAGTDANGEPILVERTDLNTNAVVEGGDTLMLRTGDHGVVERKYYHYNEDWITIMAEPGQTPVIRWLSFESACKWHLKGLSISPSIASPYVRPSSNSWVLFKDSDDSHGPTIDMVLEDCYIYSMEDSSNWVATDWHEDYGIVGTGIRIAANQCSIIDCHIKNMRHGIIIAAEGENLLLDGNWVENFSGDAIRMYRGKSVAIVDNDVTNAYCDRSIEGNHDDGIQFYAGIEYTFEDILISGNRFITRTDPNQPFPSDMQGMFLTDSYFENLRIENNLIATNHTHGITVDAVDASFSNNIEVINNTLIDPYAPHDPAKRDPAVTLKNGTHVVVRNNIAFSFGHVEQNIDEQNDHNYILDPADYYDLFVDPSETGLDFHPAEGSALIDAGSAALAPETDLEGVERDSVPDIGAYEFPVPGVFIAEYFNGYGSQVVDMAGVGTAGDGWAGAWSGGSTGPEYAPNTVEGGLAFYNEDYDNAGNLTGPNDGTVRRRINDGNTQLKTVTRAFEDGIDGTIWLTALAYPNGPEGEVTFWLDSSADDYVGLRQDGGLIQPAVRINGVDDFTCNQTFASNLTYLFIARIQINADGTYDTLDFWVKTEADDISSQAALGTPTISRSGLDIFGDSLDGIGVSFNINHSRLDAIRIANGVNAFTQVMGESASEAEPPANALNFNDFTIEQFAAGTQGLGGAVSIEDDGRTLVIEGNGWKCIELDYTVTADTVVEFDYRSTLEGEIQGIGFAEEDNLTSLYALKIYGTQWYGDQTYDNYVGTNWVHYTIPVGAFCSGLQDYFVFMNDDDGANAGISMFRDVQIYEADE